MALAMDSRSVSIARRATAQFLEIAHFCEDFLVGTRSTASPIMKRENPGTRWNASLPDLAAVSRWARTAMFHSPISGGAPNSRIQHSPYATGFFWDSVLGASLDVGRRMLELRFCGAHPGRQVLDSSAGGPSWTG